MRVSKASPTDFEPNWSIRSDGSSVPPKSPILVHSCSLDERHTVERREAGGIAERSAFGLDGHNTGRLNKKPPVGGDAQIDGDVDIGHRAKRRGQNEGRGIGPGGGNGAFEVH